MAEVAVDVMIAAFQAIPVHSFNPLQMGGNVT